MLDLDDFLAERFSASRDDPALIWPDGSWTYRDLYCAAKALLSGWADLGVVRGDRIALMATNSPNMVAAYVACMIGGLTAVPINHDLASSEIEYILNLTKPKLEIREFGDEENAQNCGDDFSFATLQENAFAIFFTSGTTGRPKGVRHGLHGMIANVMTFNESHGLESSMCMYHVLPMTYMAGFLNTLLSPLVAGASIVLGPRFSPLTALQFWKQALECGVNVMWLNPTMSGLLSRSLRSAETAIQVKASLKQIFCGTAPLSAGIREKFYETFGVPLQESYGTSELLLISAQTPEQAAVDEGVGYPLSPIELHILKEAEAGNNEIIVSTPHAMLGYLTEEGLTTTAGADGFHPTGDSGELVNGILKISGRLKDLIVRGGTNVSPSAIENVVSKVPEVDEVAVVGVPHEVWGEAIMVCVASPKNRDHAALSKAIRLACNKDLSKAQRPDQIVIMKSFPKSETGKVKRNILREQVIV